MIELVQQVAGMLKESVAEHICPQDDFDSQFDVDSLIRKFPSSCSARQHRSQGLGRLTGRS